MIKFTKQQLANKIKDIKAAFFDIDGTIFRPDFTISDSTVAAIKSLQARGIRTCLATGRPYFGCFNIIDKLCIRDPSMFASGGIIIEPGTEKLLFTENINNPTTLRFLKEISELKIFTELYTHDRYFIEAMHPLVEMHLKYLEKIPEIQNFESVLSNYDINKAVVICNTEQELTSLKKLCLKYPGYHYAFSYGASHPDITFLNITSAQASRNKAFDYFLKLFSITPAETIAFGDADADSDFLQRAGIGVAVANATLNAKNSADYVTESVEEDGVAQALLAMGLSF